MPESVAGAFRRPFKEQVAFFRQKMGNRVPTRRWDDLTGAAHDQAFMVAGAQKADLLADFASSIDRAIAEGTGLEAFRSDFRAAVSAHDWHGWTGEETKGGRAWRTRTIYRTNAQTSYAAGRFAQLTAAGWKYWVYRHGGSKHPRPEHLHVFDGLILPPDHPFWAKFYPPSDWGCSCYVLGANTLAQAKRLGGDPDKHLPDGWDQPDPATGEPAGIARGWGYAPGASVAAAVNAKIATWPAEISREFLAGLPPAARATIGAAEPVAAGPPPIASVDELDEEARRQLTRYTEDLYAAINRPLRDGEGLVAKGEPIDAVMRRAALPEKAVVYRGIGGPGADLLRAADLRPGAVVRDAGFMSTSRDRKIGVSNQKRDRRGVGVLLEIRLAKGARALDIQTVSSYPEEQEILVMRGEAMRVVRWEPESGVLEVEIDG